MASAQVELYTEDDYYNLSEDIRAELIEGNLIYNHAAPSRVHQTILGELYTIINNHIKSKGGSCRVYILKLNLYADTGVREYWIVDPYKERIFVYHLEKEHFEVETYTFHDSIPVGIFANLQIDFDSLDY